MIEQKTKFMTGRLRIYREKTHNSFMYIIAHICEINLDLFRKRRIRASEYQVSQTFTYLLLKHMASVYTP